MGLTKVVEGGRSRARATVCRRPGVEPFCPGMAFSGAGLRWPDARGMPQYHLPVPAHRSGQVAPETTCADEKPFGPGSAPPGGNEARGGAERL
jgi:hypothetical protein